MLATGNRSTIIILCDDDFQYVCLTLSSTDHSAQFQPIIMLRDEFRFGKIAQLWKFIVEIRIASALDLALVWLFTIFTKDSIDHIHSTYNLSKRSKSLLIQEFVALRICINEDLGCTSIFPRSRKRKHSPGIASQDRVILQ